MTLREQVARLAGRFAAIYVALFMASGVASMIPGLSQAHGAAVMVVARALFGPGVPDGSSPSGSGDRAIHWAGALLTLLVAGLATAVWSLRPPRCVIEQRALVLLQALTRLYLFWMMLGYGAVKVLKSQFPAPNPIWLDEALGDMSPMRLLWAFMGHSTAYTVFTGVVELAAGALLLFRRTRLLGALLTMAVMSNVLLLNLAYDVPVKLGSAHFLALAAFVAWPDRVRLLELLVPRAAEPEWPTGRTRLAARVIVAALALFAVVLVGRNAQESYGTWGDGRVIPAVVGRYDVARYVVDGRDVASGTEPGRWQRVLITERYVVAKTADHQMHAHSARLEGEGHVIVGPRIVDGVPEPGGRERRFAIAALPEGGLSLRTVGDGPRLEVELQPKSSRLQTRGFHWVSELPYNR